MKLLAFDIGATETKHAVVDSEFNISERGFLPTPLDSFENLSGMIRQIYDSCRDRVEGIAVSMPGFIDPENGMYHGSGVLRYPHEPDVAENLSRLCGCPVVIENDGKAATLAEHQLGALKGCHNAAVFVIGTGVAGGLIINGQLVRGRHFSAGEYSFVLTDPSRFREKDAILGDHCSTSFMLKRYRELSGEQISGRQFFQRLPEDPNAQQALDELCNNVAVQLYNLGWLLDPEKIAIGGGISEQPVVRDLIAEKFSRLNGETFAGQHRHKVHAEIVTARFRNDASLLGAVLSYLMYRQKPDCQ